MNYKTESQVQEFLESIGYAYFEADLKGFLTEVNRPFCQALGYTREELIGLHYRHVTHPEHIRRIYQVFHSTYLSGQPQTEVEYDYKKRDGSLSIAEGSIALLRDASGEPVGFRGVLHDVTTRKHAEEDLQRLNQAAQKELQIGRRIQADFLPEQLPQLPEWEIASYFKAARQVSGDFYDAFTLSGGKRIGLVVADVCDKGVGAAMFMALFRSLIRAFADQHYSLGWMDVLSADSGGPSKSGSVDRRRAMLSTGATALKNAIDLTNNYITRNHGRTNMFATVFFGVLDPSSGVFLYINGGQEPPLLIGSGGIKARLEPTGPAVGLLPGMEFGIQQVEMEPGDILLACTDGVSDARSPSGEFYGEERLLSLLQEPFPSAAALIDAIQSDLSLHIAGTDQYDDITMMAVRRRTGT